MDKLILVLYVDVGNLLAEEADLYTKRVSSSLFPTSVVEKLDATTFIIPRRGGGTVIESINPKFIVDESVYRDFRLKIDVLAEHINHFIETKINGES